jgi:hypothetical protein
MPTKKSKKAKKFDTQQNIKSNIRNTIHINIGDKLVKKDKKDKKAQIKAKVKARTAPIPMPSYSRPQFAPIPINHADNVMSGLSNKIAMLDSRIASHLRNPHNVNLLNVPSRSVTERVSTADAHKIEEPIIEPNEEPTEEEPINEPTEEEPINEPNEVSSPLSPNTNIPIPIEQPINPNAPTTIEELEAFKEFRRQRESIEPIRLTKDDLPIAEANFRKGAKIKSLKAKQSVTIASEDIEPISTQNTINTLFHRVNLGQEEALSLKSPTTDSRQAEDLTSEIRPNTADTTLEVKGKLIRKNVSRKNMTAEELKEHKKNLRDKRKSY